MFTVETRSGGLVEARVQALKTVDDARAYSRAIGSAVQQSKATRLVLCADHRPAAVYSQPVADELASLFGAMNSRFERLALLVAPSNATLKMQLERIVREAQNPSRRVFLAPAEAMTFLGEVLEPPEKMRLAAFLG